MKYREICLKEGKMDDLELTGIAAKWLGYEEFPFPEGMEAVIGILCKDKEGAVFYFDPLNNWNDLEWVAEMLPIGWIIEIENKKFWLYFMDGTPKRERKGRLANLPRAVLELVAELWKEGKK
jgi:hypothetical protein